MSVIYYHMLVFGALRTTKSTVFAANIAKWPLFYSNVGAIISLYPTSMKNVYSVLSLQGEIR